MSLSPILMNGDMVRAILDGRKTQTRRPVKPELWPLLDECQKVEGHTQIGPKSLLDFEFPAPWQPGDVLWVRETWAVHKKQDRRPARHTEGVVWYRAGDSIRGFRDLGCRSAYYETDGGRWRPSIYMPRWACRLRLRVKRVWFERLKDMSFDDCRAEGMCDDFAQQFDCGMENCDAKDNWHYGPSWQFCIVWNKLYPQFPYVDNPWVWACEFEVLQ